MSLETAAERSAALGVGMPYVNVLPDDVADTEDKLDFLHLFINPIPSFVAPLTWKMGLATILNIPTLSPEDVRRMRRPLTSAERNAKAMMKQMTLEVTAMEEARLQVEAERLETIEKRNAAKSRFRLMREQKKVPDPNKAAEAKITRREKKEKDRINKEIEDDLQYRTDLKNKVRMAGMRARKEIKKEADTRGTETQPKKETRKGPDLS